MAIPTRRLGRTGHQSSVAILGAAAFARSNERDTKAAFTEALARGVRVTGCTVHVVDETLDAGPIVAQAAVEVRDDDTVASLEGRIHEAEHRLYPSAVRRFLGTPWRIEGRRLRFENALPESAR